MRMTRVAVPRALQRPRLFLSEALSGRRRSGDSQRMMPAVSSIVLGSRLRPASVLKHASNVSYPCSHQFPCPQSLLTSLKNFESGEPWQPLGLHVQRWRMYSR